MYKIYLFILILLPMWSIAQEETSNYKEVSQKFVTYYNNNEYNPIFDLFSPEMQAALPLEQTNQFLIGLKAQVGKLLQKDFKKYKDTYAIYKTKFERAVLSLNISLDDLGQINGLYIQPYQENNYPKIARNKAPMILPFKNEWTVFWGGDTAALNYHIENEAQKYAFDFVMTDENGKSYQNNGQNNEDYYAFGQEIIAPTDAEVVMVVDGVKDNKPGEINPLYVPGNTVILKTAHGAYLFFAHFKQHSILVKEGERVSQGQTLGLCGNSGNSSEPHLHFHLQNIDDMNKATGGKVFFEEILVNGSKKLDYSPIKGEKVKNL